MAIAGNSDVFLAGGRAYWNSVAQDNWEIENARAQAKFENDQADRQYYQTQSDNLGTGLAGVGNPNDTATGRMLQSIGQRGEGLGPEFAQYEQGYQPPAAQQNPAVNNSATAPNAVTDNVATPRGVQPHVAAFVRQYGPMAEVAAKRLGVSPDAVLGQWGQETGWGTKVIPGTNNLGNIKSTDGTGVRATDNATGSRDLYRAYPTPEAGANGYADFISGNQKRYGAALNTGDNSQAFFAGLKVGGYAEDPDYVRKGVAATDMVRSARGVAPSGVQSQAVSRRNAAPAAPAEEVAQQPTGLQPPQAAPSSDMGPQQPQQQPAGIRPIQAQADPRMEQYKIIAQAAMRKGDMATASRAAEAYHAVRLDSEMGEISSSVMQMTPAQLNELATRMGGDVNTGLRGMLLESKFDPATGMSTVSIGDKKIQLSRTDMAQMVGGLYAIEKGAVDAGYKQIAAVNKTIADLAAQQNDLTLKSTKENNDTVQGLDRMKNDRVRTNAAVESSKASTNLHTTQNKALEDTIKRADDAANALTPYIKKYQDAETPEAKRAVLQEASLATATASKDPSKILAVLSAPSKLQADRYADRAVWAEAEKKLMESGAKPEEIQMQHEAFLARRGEAPKAAIEALYAGRDPKTGAAFDESTYAKFAATFPRTAAEITPDKLPWLNKKQQPQRGLRQSQTTLPASYPQTTEYGVAPPRALPTGTPTIDARGLLRTPKYGANLTAFNPD